MARGIITNAQRQIIRSLATRKGRSEHGLFMVEGEKSVGELLNSGFRVKWMFGTESSAAHFSDELLEEIGEKEMSRLSQLKSPSSILAVAEIPAARTIDALTGHVLLLDQVSDPGNLGTIMRIADWFGFGGIITSPGTVDPFNPKTVQASMGSFIRVPVVSMDLAEALEALQNKDYTLLSASLRGESIYDITYSGNVALLLGNEAHGVSSELQLSFVRKITIPAYGAAESLNVAVATGILCAEIRRVI